MSAGYLLVSMHMHYAYAGWLSWTTRTFRTYWTCSHSL